MGYGNSWWVSGEVRPQVISGVGFAAATLLLGSVTGGGKDEGCDVYWANQLISHKL